MKYRDVDNDSPITSYELPNGGITVRFGRGKSYTYTKASAGASRVARMRKLARAGDGLARYISRNAHDLFERD